jgi:hypothetical protein
MTDRLDEQEGYVQWLAERRGTSPPAKLTDHVMNQVTELEHQRHNIWWLRLIQQVERSRAARWSVCGGALAIGSLPFFYFASVSNF